MRRVRRCPETLVVNSLAPGEDRDRREGGLHPAVESTGVVEGCYCERIQRGEQESRAPDAPWRTAEGSLREARARLPVDETEGLAGCGGLALSTRPRLGPAARPAMRELTSHERDAVGHQDPLHVEPRGPGRETPVVRRYGQSVRHLSNAACRAAVTEEDVREAFGLPV